MLLKQSVLDSRLRGNDRQGEGRDFFCTFVIILTRLGV